MRHQFRAPWDWLLIGITSGIIILIGSLNFAIPNLFVAILLWSIILGSLVFGIYGYRIQDGQLKILRLGWSKDINLSEIKSIENKPNAMLGLFRRFGIGGLFSYIGYFSNSILGRYKAYATNMKRTVVLDVGTERFVISPDDPDAFIATLKEAQK